jgi:hypothetical protein
MRIEFVNGPDETIPLDEQPEQPDSDLRDRLLEAIHGVNIESFQVERQIRDLRPEITNVPTMRA